MYRCRLCGQIIQGNKRDWLNGRDLAEHFFFKHPDIWKKEAIRILNEDEMKRIESDLIK